MAARERRGADAARTIRRAACFALLFAVGACAPARTARTASPSPLPLAAPQTPLPSGVEVLGAACSHAEKTRRRLTFCGREGRVALVVLLDDALITGRPGEWRSRRFPLAIADEGASDPLAPAPPPAPLVYPPQVLSHVAWSRHCAPDHDGQTVFVDGRNLWVRTVRMDYAASSLLVADRDRLTADDATLIRTVLDLKPGTDLRDDEALRRAIDEHAEAERSARALAICAGRRAPE